MKSDDPARIEGAIQAFKSLGEYKDSVDKIDECLPLLSVAQVNHQEKLRIAEEQRVKEEKQKRMQAKRNKFIGKLISLAALAVATILIFGYFSIYSSSNIKISLSPNTESYLTEGYNKYVFCYYGLRRSEVLGLKWSAIDFKEKTLCIRHTVCKTVLDGQQIAVQKDTTKNKASIRTLPLIPEIEELLLETKKKQETHRKKAKGSYCKEYLDYVCVDSLGLLLKPDYLTQHFEIIIKKNNLKKIRYHDLRHSCASLLIANGVSLKEIQDWLGHSDYGTTANIYSHLEYSAKVNSANKIAEKLKLK